MCFNLSETYAELDAKRDEIIKEYLDKNNELKCRINELEATIYKLNTKNENLKKKNKNLKKIIKGLTKELERRDGQPKIDKINNTYTSIIDPDFMSLVPMPCTFYVKGGKRK